LNPEIPSHGVHLLPSSIGRCVPLFQRRREIPRRTRADSPDDVGPPARDWRGSNADARSMRQPNLLAELGGGVTLSTGRWRRILPVILSSTHVAIDYVRRSRSSEDLSGLVGRPDQPGPGNRQVRKRSTFCTAGRWLIVATWPLRG
jgi:hypothetical protein